mgnify:CR=1 FL=1
MNLSPLQIARYQYQPKLPGMLRNGISEISEMLGLPEGTISSRLSRARKKLEEILKEISGAGKVRLLLTEEAGSENIYQTDEGAEQSHLDTVIVMNSQREELGLIRQVIAPRYRGAVVVCQGGDRAEVRLAVVNAVKSVTGLSSDRITVLKMK